MSSGLDWSTRPAGEERLAVPWPTDTIDSDPDNSLPKRSPKSLHTRGISSKTRITSLDAVRSAQSLISAMRDVATRTDDDLPLRQSQISVIRSVFGQQFVFPDEAAADEGDICALPTVTREVYGTVYSTATNRAAPAPVVYQSTVQPTIPLTSVPPNVPVPVPITAADPNPQPPISFTIVSTTTTTATVSATATTMTTVATTANSTVTATTTLISTSTATVTSSVSGTTTVTSVQTPTSTTTTTTTTCQSPSIATSTFTVTDRQTSLSTTTTTAFAPTTLVITISLPTAINTIPLALAQYKQERL
ncbi:hypothetical protein FBU31_006801 [Coemansia sp. 'formosensis']|nr:hypothetical protein FBU31_006801 [Coemansia sp. 'formosensis']